MDFKFLTAATYKIPLNIHSSSIVLNGAINTEPQVNDRLTQYEIC